MTFVILIWTTNINVSLFTTGDIPERERSTNCRKRSRWSCSEFSDTYN
ncbi:hypothetical protein X961_5760 [Burkholderia pseudomallei MSHR5613]|nr:hypothetical protein X961_5760 [Burkholderia pseudomallei MSHR5613]